MFGVLQLQMRCACSTCTPCCMPAQGAGEAVATTELWMGGVQGKEEWTACRRQVLQVSFVLRMLTRVGRVGQGMCRDAGERLTGRWAGTTSEGQQVARYGRDSFPDKCRQNARTWEARVPSTLESCRRPCLLSAMRPSCMRRRCECHEQYDFAVAPP